MLSLGEMERLPDPPHLHPPKSRNASVPEEHAGDQCSKSRLLGVIYWLQLLVQSVGQVVAKKNKENKEKQGKIPPSPSTPTPVRTSQTSMGSVSAFVCHPFVETTCWRRQ